jgi:Flp pilus assembly protein TadG
VVTEQRERGLMGNNKRERGAALIEAAIVMPLLMALVFGIWTVARAYNVRNTMEHAVREGVRFGATELPWDGNSDDDVRDVIDSELGSSAIPKALVNTLCINMDSAPCGFGTTAQGYDQVAVRIEYPNYPLNFLFFSTTVNLTVEAVGRYEG